MTVVDDNYILEEDDLPILVEVLTSASPKWELIGSGLRLRDYMMAQCKNSDIMLSLRNVLKKWIQGNGHQTITLGQLRKTLASNCVGCPRLSCGLVLEFSASKGSDYMLSHKDMSIILLILTPVAYTWDNIGFALGISTAVLNVIKKDNSYSMEALMYVVQEWLQGNGSYPQTLFKLRDALASEDVGHRNLAMVLIPKFYAAKRNKGHLIPAEPAKEG